MADLITVRKELDTSIYDEGVLGYDTEDDMLQLSDRIDDFSVEENAILFGKMPDGELSRWAERVYSEGFIDHGLSLDQRHEMYDRMAGHFDGALLARIATHFNKEPGEVEALGKAIAEKASAQEKLAFLKAIAPSIAGPEVGPGDGHAVNIRPNEVGVAAAEVLASLRKDPVEFNAAVSALHEAGRLDELVEAAVGLRRGTSAAQGGSADTGPSMPEPFGPKPAFQYDKRLLDELKRATEEAGDPRSRKLMGDTIEDLRLSIVRGGSPAHEFPKPASEIGLTKMVADLRNGASAPASGAVAAR